LQELIKEKESREKIQEDYYRNNEELKSALKLINEIEAKLKTSTETEERAQQKIAELYEKYTQAQAQVIDDQEK